MLQAGLGACSGVAEGSMAAPVGGTSGRVDFWSCGTTILRPGPVCCNRDNGLGGPDAYADSVGGGFGGRTAAALDRARARRVAKVARWAAVGGRLGGARVGRGRSCRKERGDRSLAVGAVFLRLVAGWASAAGVGGRRATPPSRRRR